MSMNKLFLYILAGCLSLAACSDDPAVTSGADTDVPGTLPDDSDNNPETTPTGYADPDGVLLLSSGTYTVENAFLTYIAPDGTVKNQVYATANSTDLGNDGVALYLCDGKQYILCNDWRTAEGKNNNGLLTIADAETLQKKESFDRSTMVFQHPVNEGELEEVDENMNGIAVLDERNIFIFAQGVLRFDSTTGKLTLIKGAYDIGNAGTANTVESIASSKGAMVVNGHLYAATGGFWSGTGLLEFSKDKDEVSRRLDLNKGSLVSGMCLMDDGTLVVGTYTRGRDIGYLSFIDLENWEVKEQKTINANIGPGGNTNSGITYLNGYIYFTGAEETEFTSASYTTLSRYSIETGRVEKDVVNFKDDEPTANLLDCNIVADPGKGYIYVATSKELWEGLIPESNILVYDCNDETPTLVNKISGVTHYVTGIYPISLFTEKE